MARNRNRPKNSVRLKKSITFVAQLDNISYLCNMEKVRYIIFFKKYFTDFFEKQTQKVREKIVWTFDVIEKVKNVPEAYLKHIENTEGLYEIRVQQGSGIYRIFCFFDEGKLVVLANGFQKKTQKTPRREIDLALKIKQEYEQEKKLNKNGK